MNGMEKSVFKCELSQIR